MEINIGNIVLEEEINIGDLELDVIKEYPQLEDLEITPSGIEQEFNHPNSYGYDNVKVKAVESDTLNIIPTSTPQQYIGLYGVVNVLSSNKTMGTFTPTTTGESLDVECGFKPIFVAISPKDPDNAGPYSLTLLTFINDDVFVTTQNAGGSNWKGIVTKGNIESSTTLMIKENGFSYKNDSNYYKLNKGIEYTYVAVGEDTTEAPTYTELEYIENTGKQYIDIGIIPNKLTGVEIVYEAVDYTSSQYILGSRADSKATINYALNGSGSRTDWSAIFNATSTYSSSDLVRTGNKYKSTLTPENGGMVWTLTDMDNNLSFVKTISSITVNATSNLYLFAFNDENIHTNLRVYSCKIYNDNTLIRDLIPVLDSMGKACLYDKLSNRYYYNAGKGNFLYKEKEEEPTVYSIADIEEMQVMSFQMRKVKEVEKDEENI